MTIAPRSRIILAGLVGLVMVAAAIWAVIAARGPADDEAARERPVVTPQRVFSDDGQTILRIDAATLARSGIITAPLAASDGTTTVPVFATVVDTPKRAAADRADIPSRPTAKSTRSRKSIE